MNDMPRKRRKPEPVADTQAEQDLIVYLEERASQPNDAPLTAEEFMRAADDLEAAKRLAALKAERVAREE
jgi:hypothetical protein